MSNSDKEENDENAKSENRITFKEKSETIRASSSSKKSSSKKKTKKSGKPEWNRYIWHLNDKQRTKLMELPEIPDTVKQENKELLNKRRERRTRSATSFTDNATVNKAKPTEKINERETTKKILKSVLKPANSISSSRSVSRTKSYTSDKDYSEKPNIRKASILKRSESNNTMRSETDQASISSSSAKLGRKKIQFRSVRGTKDHTDLKDLETKHNSINYGFDQMQVSASYNKLLRSLRANL